MGSGISLSIDHPYAQSEQKTWRTRPSLFPRTAFQLQRENWSAIFTKLCSSSSPLQLDESVIAQVDCFTDKAKHYHHTTITTATFFNLFKENMHGTH